MIELLFHGKRVDNGEWVEGYYYESKISGCFILSPKIKVREKDGVVIKDSFEVGEVIPETAGQFTGLTDKNGNKIFEGGIVKYSDEEYYCPEDCTESIGEIVFENGAFGIGCRKELPIDLDYWCDNDNFVSLWELYWNLNCAQCELSMIEVIGNIHDSPELLEVEE